MDKNTYALVSVTDKSHLDALTCLSSVGVKFISTGGTAKALRGLGFDVMEISEFTGVPEMLDGRLKTINHRVAGGILADRTDPDHVRQCEEHNLPHIAFVIVNLYDFEGDPSIEQIDIGGPSLLRAAAKNHKNTTVIVHPTDYSVMKGLIDNSGSFEDYMRISETFRKDLAEAVFEATSSYDNNIFEWFLAERAN